MNAMTAMLLFTAWTLLLIILVFAYRGVRVLSGTKINSWPRGSGPAQTGDPDIIKRVVDAHANCLENLPIFAVLVLAAAAVGKSAAIDPLGIYVLYARLGQSIVHLIGTSVPLVLIRATFWAVQLAVFVIMLVKLLG